MREAKIDNSIETYTVEELARALKVDPYTVRRFCRERKIPAFKFGGQWRFKKSEISAWLKKQENKR